MTIYLDSNIYSIELIQRTLLFLRGKLSGNIKGSSSQIRVDITNICIQENNLEILFLSFLNEELLRVKVNEECKNLKEIIYAQAISPINNPENYLNE